MQTVTEDSDQCPLSEAALLLSSKWDLIVVYNLLDGPHHFNRLKEKISIPLPKELTSATLSRSLKKLEIDGLAQRNVKSEVGQPVKILYSLTKKGEELEPVISELYKWSQKWIRSASQHHTN